MRPFNQENHILKFQKTVLNMLLIMGFFFYFAFPFFGIPIMWLLHILKVKVTQSCPTLCDPMTYTVHGILQARILEWVAYPFSWGSS